MNAPSYDPRMEKLPVFVSYPRSGSNWVNSLMEVYFGRPRLRQGISFLDKKAAKKAPMWFHDHDYHSSLKLSHNNILYLYRNPDDVIFSSLKSEYNGKINPETVGKEVLLLRDNLMKYLVRNQARVILKYEKLKSDLSEFQKMISWLNPKESIDMAKIRNANKIVSKQNVVARSADKRFFGQQILTANYENERSEFKQKYGSFIAKNVITTELKGFF